MLNYIKHNIYLTCLILGTFIAISSPSWFICWLGLEINLMSLIPLIINKMNPQASETAIKYFITQALASVMLILSSTIMFSNNSSNSIFLINSTITMALAIKMGAAPFHFWLPQVIQTSEWMQIFIILTWQKIAPMLLILYSKINLIKFILISSCVIGVMGAINQSILKKILVYSSILHTGWLLVSLMCSEMIWVAYFSLYTIISFSIIIPLMFINIYSIKQLFFTKTNSFFSYIIFLNILSLAGIPPLTGFFMKLITIITIMTSSIDYLIATVLIMSSLIALFFYLRIMYSSMMNTMAPNKTMYESYKTPYIIPLTLSLSILMNLTAPVLLLV